VTPESGRPNKDNQILKMVLQTKLKGRLFMRKISFFVVLLGFLSMAAFPCDALHLYLKFDEAIQKADVIFWGRVSDQVSRYDVNGKMIFTDVYFDILELIYKSEKSEPITGSSIVLTFAGGTVGGTTVRISDVPTFETGSSYLVFTKMDGIQYASPIVGGFQGLFKIITDEEHGRHYPLAQGRRGISEIRDGDIITSPPISNVKAGVIEKLPEKEPGAKFHDVAPKPAEGMDPQKVKASVSKVKREMPEKIMTTDELITVIREKINGKGGDK